MPDFSYDATEIEDSPLFQVRFTVGDTDSTDPLLKDPEISFLLAQNDDDVQATSLACCYRILAKLAREVDASGAGIHTSRSQKVQHYRDLIQQLDREVAATAAVPSAMSNDAVEEAEADGDFTPSRMSVGMDDLT